MFGKAIGGLYSSYIDLYLFDNGRSKKEIDTKNTLQDVGRFSKPIFNWTEKHLIPNKCVSFLLYTKKGNIIHVIWQVNNTAKYYICQTLFFTSP